MCNMTLRRITWMMEKCASYLCDSTEYRTVLVDCVQY
jgi:hypothetical protein